MKFITTTDSRSGEEIELAYSDYGSGKPVVLIHGWPLSREMWEYQLEDLVDAVVAALFLHLNDKW